MRGRFGRMGLWALGAAVITSGAWATGAWASQPTDSEIDEAVLKYEAGFKAVIDSGNATVDRIVAVNDEFFEPLDVGSMSSRQICRLPFVFFQFGSGMDRTMARLDELLAENPEDIHAMIRRADLRLWSKTLGWEGAEEVDKAEVDRTLTRAAAHPELADAVSSGVARYLVAWFERLEPADRERAMRRVMGLLASPDAHPAVSVELADNWKLVREHGFSRSELAEFRGVMQESLSRGIDRLEARERPTRDDTFLLKQARAGLAMLETDRAFTPLLGNGAPPLEFVWSSDESVTSLADLRGRVVLLEFWVTGCGHCVASLPRMRELAEHYAASDVAIVAVTSPQGRHHNPQGGPVISVEGDPHAEYELMAELIRENDVNWTVVFTEESVFNPAFEVKATPHLTLIDPDGRVVHNDMHPYHGFEKNAAKIDAALEAFGMLGE